MTTATNQPPVTTHPVELLSKRFIARARCRRLRSMLDFAESEIVLPTGPFAGRRYHADRQPFNRLYFNEVDSGDYRRLFVTGPAQTSKTVIGYVIPGLYHLFECCETVILGVPTIDMANDKWREDILPVIKSSGFAHLLPTTGDGSRGGAVEAVKFQNGATLKFMPGGGGDEKRSGFESRILLITELDKLDEVGSSSREADKVSQMEARLKSHGRRKLTYGESTPSFEDARIWTEVTKRGTNSVIELHCPHCREFVDLGRDHLVGWKEAESILEAQENAYFGCPACGAKWSEEDRYQANLGARLVHGRVDTDTLGFRWTAAHNMFEDAGLVGGDEWTALRATDEVSADRKMCQFTWGLPVKRDSLGDSRLTIDHIKRRVNDKERLPKGRMPTGAKWLTVGVDLGKHLGHYESIAWSAGGRGHIVDYGVFTIYTDQLGEEVAMYQALKDFDEFIMGGYMNADGQIVHPHQVWIDSRYQHEGKVVFRFCRERTGRQAEARYRPIRGFGEGVRHLHRYKAGNRASANTVHIGEEYHVVALRNDKVYVVDINADHWKSAVHARLTADVGTPGSLTVYESADQNEHIKLAKHLASEERIEEFVPHRGIVARWRVKSRENHFFDCTYLATAAAHFCGVRVIEDEPVAALPRRESRPVLRTPDNRPYFIGDRH